mmetsp:Transcript_26408/g.53645  ORF Transcript_26408/g.53645 Transcript_26408/m.53645 type:complete len:249 (+) Transcript_26408:930-1676(+)
MCSSSLTTSSVSPRPVPRCPPFLDVSRPLSVTSPPWPLIWVVSRSVLPPPPRVPLPPSRLSTSRPMILPILPPRPPSPILTLPLSCPVLLPNLVSTPPSIPSTPPPVCLIPVLSVTSTTRLPVPLRRSFRITRAFRTLSPFLVWTSFPRTISSSSPAHVRYKSSCPSPSTLLRSSPVLPVSSSASKKPSTVSSKSSTVSMMIFPRVRSTWSVTSMRSRPRPPPWLSKLSGTCNSSRLIGMLCCIGSES